MLAWCCAKCLRNGCFWAITKIHCSTKPTRWLACSPACLAACLHQPYLLASLVDKSRRIILWSTKLLPTGQHTVLSLSWRRVWLVPYFRRELAFCFTVLPASIASSSILSLSPFCYQIYRNIRSMMFSPFCSVDFLNITMSFKLAANKRMVAQCCSSLLIFNSLTRKLLCSKFSLFALLLSLDCLSSLWCFVR